MKLRAWASVVRQVMSSRGIKRGGLGRAARTVTAGVLADASVYRRVRLRLSFATRLLQVNSDLMSPSVTVVNHQPGL